MDRLRDLLIDLRYARRALLRRPGFALLAVLALTLGIGANAAVFTVVDGVLLKPLPVPDPERLQYLVMTRVEKGGAYSVPYHNALWLSAPYPPAAPHASIRRRPCGRN